MTQHTPHSSIDDAEIQRFSKIAGQWWDEQGPFKPLHQLNPTRLQYIRDCLIAHFQRNQGNHPPLDGLKILDIGCGGGLVAEPLTRMGAHVTGIDAGQEAIDVAIAHGKLMKLDINYICTTAEELAPKKQKYDVVLALEIVEHVADVGAFLRTCVELIAPGGALILSTLNRTTKSYAFAIVGAEYIMRMLPVGTHEWDKFQTPAELAAHLRPLGFEFASLKGLSYCPITSKWSLSNDLDINYMGCARRNDAKPYIIT
jgi:2-polyprenyl-6-hydroxyphenyl methylase/3-demethylubiquinone-9 3-methyltransferase